ncbi:Gifsy-2 prophage protein [Klebsiella pneumoniae]|nr:Gifsy-2 prophage protein [Klebsiella pneumoniae]
MYGRFAQSQTREEYLAYLAEEAERDIAYVPEPIGRYNVAPGTKVLLLSVRNEEPHPTPFMALCAVVKGKTGAHISPC